MSFTFPTEEYNLTHTSKENYLKPNSVPYFFKVLLRYVPLCISCSNYSRIIGIYSYSHALVMRLDWKAKLSDEWLRNLISSFLWSLENYK